MRNIIIAACAAIGGMLVLGGTPAKADCLFGVLCGKRGPTHQVDPGTLSKHERELMKSRHRRRSSDCYFHEFDHGRSINLPIFFAKSGALASCPGNRLTFCINCAAFANGHRGSGPIFGIRTAVAYSLPRGSTGVWLPVGVNLWDVAWCDNPGHVASWTFRRFK